MNKSDIDKAERRTAAPPGFGSRPGEGGTVFFLPPVAVRRRRVLLVDGHVLFRLGLVSLARDLAPGLEFFEADDLDDAARALAPQAAMDLVLIESVLLLERGRLDAKKVAELCPGVPFVVTVCHDASFATGDIENFGAAGVLSKNETPNTWFQAIDAVLAGGRHLPEPRRETPPWLSPRLIEVLDLLKDGRSNKEIALRLAISDGTVKLHVAKILRHLGAGNRTHAVAIARERGLVS